MAVTSQAENQVNPAPSNNMATPPARRRLRRQAPQSINTSMGTGGKAKAVNTGFHIPKSAMSGHLSSRTSCDKGHTQALCVLRRSAALRSGNTAKRRPP
jgi:hypothetical protein